MIEVGTKYLSVNVTDVIDYLKSTTKYFRHINKKDNPLHWQVDSLPL